MPSATGLLIPQSPLQLHTLAPSTLHNREVAPIDEVETIIPRPENNGPLSFESDQKGAQLRGGQDEPEIDDAVQQSFDDMVERENSELQTAILNSKMDQLSSDGVIALKLTRHAQAAEVATALCSSPELQKCRDVVEAAGCELQPEWAGGAWLLLPLTCDQFKEAGVQTGDIHILVLSEDEEALRRALKSVPMAKRPKLKRVALEDCGLAEPAQTSELSSPAEKVQQSNEANEMSSGSALQEFQEYAFDIVVHRTFIHLPIPKEDGEDSSDRQTAYTWPLNCEYHVASRE